MITCSAWSGKRYAVLGLGRSGRSTVASLLASGAEVVAWDENEAARNALNPLPFRGEDSREAAGEGESGGARTPPLPTSLRSATLSPEGERERLSFADPLTLDLTGFTAVVAAPGIPLNRHPIKAHAAAHEIPIIGDIELFAQARPELPPHKVVGITGTNGKSTTTALVHHILAAAGVPSLMGGNIGLPILGQDPLPEGGVYVLELSSYQIDLTQSLDCDVAVLLNITPDHLDRYEGFEAYAASKERLLEMQSVTGTIVVGSSYPGQRRQTYDSYFMSGRVHCQPIWTMGDPADLWDAFDESRWLSVQGDWPTLQGPHNAENAGAAMGACHALGLTDAQIDEGFRTYPGLPHRMQRVRERDGVLFINDSKATNPDSTAPALAAYPYIHWIVGGRAKGDTLGPCEQHLDHVRAAYTIGEAGPMFARLLEGRVPVTQSEILERAVADAARAAKRDEVVLLSPACASFDQFKDFEARGDAFRAAVEALP